MIDGFIAVNQTEKDLTLDHLATPDALANMALSIHISA
jgi:hypothetical protein